MTKDNILLFPSQKVIIIKRSIYEAASKLSELRGTEQRAITEAELFYLQENYFDGQTEAEFSKFITDVESYISLTQLVPDDFETMATLPIVVDFSVYQASQQIGRRNLTDERGYTDWNLAEEQIELCKDNSDMEGLEFFKKVRSYLMETDFASQDAKVVIIR